MSNQDGGRQLSFSLAALVFSKEEAKNQLRARMGEGMVVVGGDGRCESLSREHEETRKL